MSWELSAKVAMRNDRVSDVDADRQQLTASEVLRRLDMQPGVILADEVGMGKTYVALAVAVSVLEATRRKRPVVVMVPPAVAEKWPNEWAVFSERCLAPGHGIRASGAVRRGSEFLKLLDDPADRRNHLIFLTHGALTSNLNDPFIRLALLRRATLRRAELTTRKRAIARFASELLNDKRFTETNATALLESPVTHWRDVWNRRRPDELEDDPVPFAVERAIGSVDLTPLREAISAIPVHRNAGFTKRLRAARRLLNQALNETWTKGLGALDVHLPLLILDEAHHVKNANQLARLFANEEAERDADALQGPLGNMFDKMLFLTATPFQLGHDELLRVLDRFHGVRWASAMSRQRFDSQLDLLSASLDRAQATALRFERAWSRLLPIDLPDGPSLSFSALDQEPGPLTTALSVGTEARAAIEDAEKLLRPWVIRHVKPQKSLRRSHRAGRGIVDDAPAEVGLPVSGAATLPFLLASRAQAIAALQGESGHRATRSFFAYGLASSFEAYADTRRNRIASLDDHVASEEDVDTSPQLTWYLDRIAAALPEDSAEGWSFHPKVAATVDRVRDLWCNGEKALVFCFYVETGRALRAHISRALRAEIVSRGAVALGLSPDDDDAVLEELDRIGERLLRVDSRGYDEFHAQVEALASNLDDELRAQVAEIVIRFMRTPSFLVRFADLSTSTSVDDLVACLDRPDLSGTSLASKVRAFALSLERLVDVEHHDLLEALSGIQTGGIATTAENFDSSERSHAREVLLPNVRLANGGVRQETRRRLMLTFNTPFFPEVLVASSVMAEGVDLHHDCRHVIHHDLDWNPSTLEQRTGRVDRIGSKAERAGRPVVIYEPYLAGTHDEKMYRVVKDRERWFGIVMGEEPAADERTTEAQAERVPLPTELADQLTMDLAVVGRRETIVE